MVGSSQLVIRKVDTKAVMTVTMKLPIFSEVTFLNIFINSFLSDTWLNNKREAVMSELAFIAVMWTCWLLCRGCYRLVPDYITAPLSSKG